MRKWLQLLMACLLPSVLLATPASAKNERKLDLNEKVCETIVATGSRLGKKRVCASRSEWEEKRRVERRVIEEVQTRICVINPATGTCAGS